MMPQTRPRRTCVTILAGQMPDSSGLSRRLPQVRARRPGFAATPFDARIDKGVQTSRPHFKRNAVRATTSYVRTT